jgi:hypothetical protein
MPRDLRLAGGTKGAARLVDRKIQGQPKDADVEKGSDAGAKDEGEPAEQSVVRHFGKGECCTAGRKE